MHYVTKVDNVEAMHTAGTRVARPLGHTYIGRSSHKQYNPAAIRLGHAALTTCCNAGCKVRKEPGSPRQHRRCSVCDLGFLYHQQQLGFSRCEPPYQSCSGLALQVHLWLCDRRVLKRLRPGMGGLLVIVRRSRRTSGSKSAIYEAFLAKTDLFLQLQISWCALCAASAGRSAVRGTTGIHAEWIIHCQQICECEIEYHTTLLNSRLRESKEQKTARAFCA
jgi:hypothetical protein